jgi:succinate dehydrogenase / fumarate reductase membrane anchor subunit
MSGFTYAGWKNLFTFTCLMMPLGQILATLAMISLAWHAWIGIRDIWMDYVKPVGLRLFLMVLTILWLVGSIVYFVHILWRV